MFLFRAESGVNFKTKEVPWLRYVKGLAILSEACKDNEAENE